MQHLLPNTTLQGGKYKIIKILGQGGFGITYLAAHSGLECKVAIKEFFMKEHCVRDEHTGQVTLGTVGSQNIVNRLREKFLKEAHNIAKLSHPNIVHILDVFEENNTSYYVMEFAENGSLADKVGHEGYLSESVATRYILQIADALDYIHRRKMNHLDIKPANIVLNDKNESILIDFGVAKQYDVITGEQTSTTPACVSNGYAPMEQYMQGGVSTFSPETDIYALGATFYKLLTGQTPPNASQISNEGLSKDELKAKGVCEKNIILICKSMEARKKDRIRDVRSFIAGLDKVGITCTSPELSESQNTRIGINRDDTTILDKKREGKKEWNDCRNIETKVTSIVEPIIHENPEQYNRDNTDDVFKVKPKQKEVLKTIQSSSSTKSPHFAISKWVFIFNQVVFGISGIYLLFYLSFDFWKRNTFIEYFANGHWGWGCFKFVGNLFLELGILLISIFCTFIPIICSEDEDMFRLKRKYGILITILSILIIIFASVYVVPKHIEDNVEYDEQMLEVDANAKLRSGTLNGHEWVDLGLSVKWATCNVGASSPSDYGDYYAWGETSTKSRYDFNNYFDCLDSKGSMGTYKNKKERITPSSGHDTARENWGSTWRMPTDAENEELSDKCKWTWTSKNGHNGYTITGPNGNSIFLPAAGYRYVTDSVDIGSRGSYWSSTLTLDADSLANSLEFNSSGHYTESLFYRSCGKSVRPVTE